MYFKCGIHIHAQRTCVHAHPYAHMRILTHIIYACMFVHTGMYMFISNSHTYSEELKLTLHAK